MTAAPRRPKLLVVDDGDRYIELAHYFLRDYGYATRCDLPGPCWTCPQRPGCELTHAHDAREADDALRRHPDVEVVLLDVAFDLPAERLLPLPPLGAPKSRPRKAAPAPGTGLADEERQRRLQGLAILAHLRRARGELPVVLLTSQEEIAYADAAEGLLVDEFVSVAGADALDARAVGLLIERVLARRRDSAEAGGYLFGRSAAMARLRRDALSLARTALPVLLLGETGTGKSALCEQVLHPATGRGGPFVAVDLSAIPESLVAAELFGTARGAFSGAVEREGRFERASGGTLLLDEIGNLPPEIQRMLLLVLQDGRVTRLGENTPRPVQVKLVAATNADLAGLVRAGKFRADLYARLNPAARLVLPPLRERPEDLEALLTGLVRKCFAAGANRQLLAAYCDAAALKGPIAAELHVGRKEPPAGRGVQFVLSPDTLTALRSHPWPGNVRELELLAASATLLALSDALRAAEAGRGSRAGAHAVPIPAKLVRELLAQSWVQPDEADAADAAQPGGLTVELRPGATLHAAAQALERQVYAHLFDTTGGDFARMAERLLGGDPAQNARRVRLRFNQLGLRARGRDHDS